MTWSTSRVTRSVSWRPLRGHRHRPAVVRHCQSRHATRHRLVFVPLDQATVGPGYIRVGYGKKQVKDAPSIGTDGELPAGDEEAVFKHYGLAYEPGGGGERRLARR